LILIQKVQRRLKYFVSIRRSLDLNFKFLQPNLSPLPISAQESFSPSLTRPLQPSLDQANLPSLPSSWATRHQVQAAPAGPANRPALACFYLTCSKRECLYKLNTPTPPRSRLSVIRPNFAFSAQTKVAAHFTIFS
jgi:hypothetical protein